MIVTAYVERIPKISSTCSLTDIFVCEFMREADPLRLMLHGLTIHNCMFELFHNGLVNGIALTRG